MTERIHGLSRRNFLLAVGAGGAVSIAAAIAARRAAQPQSPVRSNHKRATRGYQASAHVHHYYRTAKI